jgi:preprotein translocase subunit YajC
MKLVKFSTVFISFLAASAALADEVAKAVPPAATDAASQAPGLTSLVFQLLIIFAIFYFLLIRPQNKKHREHLATLTALKKGDKVLTGGGIVGIITSSDEANKFVDVEIASGIKIQVLKSSISELIEAKNKPAAIEAKSEAKAEKK